MKIFISYPSELRPVAERLRLGLLAESHEVFLDKHNLPPAQDFDAAIRSAVDASDVFIFLVAPQSVAPGSYARTELKFAQAKWPHPKGHVLPVMCEATDFETIPEYARAVNILTPDGDLVAETTAAVATLERPSRATNSTKALIAGSVIILIGLAAWLYGGNPSIASIDIQTYSTERLGFGNHPDVFSIDGTATNTTNETHYLTGAHGESDNADVSIDATLQFEDEATQLEYRAGQLGTWRAQVSFTSTKTGTGLTQAELDPLTWRFCLEFVTEIACTSMDSKSFTDTFSASRPKDLSATLGNTGTVVVAHGEHFLLAQDQPSGLYSIKADGTILHGIDLEGEPTAIAATNDTIVVGLQTPDSLVVIDSASFTVTARHTIDTQPAEHGWGSGYTSTRIESMAIQDDLLWIVTSGGDGESSLMFSSDWGQSWSIPQYANGRDDTLQSALSAEGLRLVSESQTLWGVETSTSPSSVYQLAADSFTDFTGHDVEDISCANDLIAHNGQAITLLDCDNNLIELVNENGRLKKTRSIASLRFPRPAGLPAQQWETNFVTARRGTHVAAIQTGQIDAPEFAHIGIAVKKQNQSAEFVFDQNGYTLRGMATQEDATLILLSNSTGIRLPLLIEHPAAGQPTENTP